MNSLSLMSLVQILDTATSTSFDDGPCHGFGFVVRIIKNGLFPILQIGIPIVLIVLGTLDLGKAVISSDDKAVKEAQSKLIKRCIYAILVFFIVTLVSLVFSMVGSVAGEKAPGLQDWSECWNSPEEASSGS